MKDLGVEWRHSVLVSTLAKACIETVNAYLVLANACIDAGAISRLSTLASKVNVLAFDTRHMLSNGRFWRCVSPHRKL